MAVRSLSIRIEDEMLEKLGFVAKYEGRSANSHILVLIRDCIKRHEAEHGAIEGDVAPSENVSPARKSRDSKSPD